MSEEDEFGDLYSDLLPATAIAPPSISSRSQFLDDYEEAELAAPGSMFSLDDSEDEQKELPRAVEVTRINGISEEKQLAGEGQFPIEQGFSAYKDNRSRDTKQLNEGEEALGHTDDPSNPLGESSAREVAYLDVAQAETAPPVTKQATEIKLEEANGAPALEDNDPESDSEDDLHIVLNDQLPPHQVYERDAAQLDSEDEDDEDFVVLASNVEVDDGEELPLPLDGAQSMPTDKPLSGGEKQGVTGEEKCQSGKGTSQHQRSSYGYHHQFRYVRPGAIGGSGAAPSGVGSGNRLNVPKGGNGRVDWMGRGYTSQKIALLSWSNMTPRGFLSGFEYCLPSNKTVFDIDIDCLEDKPWRHSNVDVSDFFNFGFNENSWKEYCKQLAQLRLESTMQSKIKVYESVRSEQELKPPSELGKAASGMRKASTEIKHHPYAHQAGSAITSATAAGASEASGNGQGDTVPMGRPIQVEWGGGERRPSAGRNRMRDSDAILLIDSTADCSTKDQVDSDASQKEKEIGVKVCCMKSEVDMLDTIVPKKARLSLDADSQARGKKPNLQLRGVSSSEMQVHQPSNAFSLLSAARHELPTLPTPAEGMLIDGRVKILSRRGAMMGGEYHKGQSNGTSDHDGVHEGKKIHPVKFCDKCPVTEDHKFCATNSRIKSDRKVDVKIKAKSSANAPQKAKKRSAGVLKKKCVTLEDECTTRKSSHKSILMESLDIPVELETPAEARHPKNQSYKKEDDHLDKERFEGSKINEMLQHHVKKKDRKSKSKLNAKRKKKKGGGDLSTEKLDVPDEHLGDTQDQSKKQAKVEQIKRIRLHKKKVKHKERGHLILGPAVDITSESERNYRVDKQEMRERSETFVVGEHEFYTQIPEEGVCARDEDEQKNGSPGVKRKSEDKITKVMRKKKSQNRRRCNSKKDSLEERTGFLQLKGLCDIQRKEEQVTRLQVVGVRNAHDKSLHSSDEILFQQNFRAANNNHEILTGESKHPEIQEPEDKCVEDYLHREGRTDRYDDLAGLTVQGHIIHQSNGTEIWSASKLSQPVYGKVMDKKKRKSKSRKPLAKDTRVKAETNTSSDLGSEYQQNHAVHIANKEHNSGPYQTDSHSVKVYDIDVQCDHETLSCHREVNVAFDRWQENSFGAEALLIQDQNLVMLTSHQEHKQNGRSKLERWTNQEDPADKEASLDGLVYKRKLKKKIRRSDCQCIVNGSHELAVSPSNSEQGDCQIVEEATDQAIKATGKVSGKVKAKAKNNSNLNQKPKGTSKRERGFTNSDDRLYGGQHFQQCLNQQQLELAAKLEKRRERFKLPIREDKEPARTIFNSNHQPLSEAEVKAERPMRKRRWGGMLMAQ